ncbi:hypothetical protein [Fusobacterium perfoetens]|uniref:hypothetical protein n=1 Tax=Fusobacterium perfoetens TaxID=852 RepID=UPI000484C178|nr:hypothetical protein [Fusobacterium perfoetens]
MKKLFFISLLISSILGCSNSNVKNINCYDYFNNNSVNFSGGFENSGYNVKSNIVSFNGKNLLIENITDTATTVEKVYILEKDYVKLVSTTEGKNVNLKDLDFDKGEIILKSPIKVGDTWTSNGNKYIVVEINDSIIKIKKIFPSNITEITTYEKGKGIVDKKINY